jgi:hypothetical protein
MRHCYMKLKCFLVILSSLIVIQCNVFNVPEPKDDWAAIDQWDKNQNESLDLAEFVEGYHTSRFFEKWNKSKSISDSAFFHFMFGRLDGNHDMTLDSAEYNSRKVLWSFPGTISLKQWDKNHDGALGLNEFMEAANQNLLRDFDSSADGQITEAEMAQAMFRVCDKNHDGQVRSMEFYLWEVYRR